MNSERLDCAADTLADAQDAHLNVRALAELLHGCPPGYQISAGLFVGLVDSVRLRLDNVVDGLRTVCKEGTPA